MVIGIVVRIGFLGVLIGNIVEVIFDVLESDVLVFKLDGYRSKCNWRGILLLQIIDTGVTRLHYCVVSMLPLYQHVNRYPHILHSVSLRITYSHTKSKNFLFAVFSCLFSHKPMWR